MTIYNPTATSAAPSEGIHFEDGELLTFGNTDAAPNVIIGWDTADANANAFKIGLPSGGAVDVPYLHIGRASDINGVDLGLGAGETRSKIAIWDNSLAKYATMGWGSNYFEFGSGGSAQQFYFVTTVNTNQLIVLNDSNFVLGSSAAFLMKRNTIYGDDDIRMAFDSHPLVMHTTANQVINFGKGVHSRPTLYITSETSFSTSTAQWGSLEHDTNDFLIKSGTGNIKLSPADYVVLDSSKADTGDPTGEEGMIYINTFDNAAKIYADGAWRTIVSW